MPPAKAAGSLDHAADTTVMQQTCLFMLTSSVKTSLLLSQPSFSSERTRSNI